jgi:proteasome accessory factor B
MPAKKKPTPAAASKKNRPSPAGRATGNRPAVMRMKRIFDLLKKDDFPNCQRLAEELETAPKTIQRDINFMRDRLGLPIAYDAQEHGYHFTDEVHEFPTVQVTQGELLALLVAHKSIEQYRGTPYHAQLETAFAKLLAPLDGMTGYAPSDETVSFKVSAPAAHELDVFDHLGRAIADQIEIGFDYRKPGESLPAPRRVQPLHLAHRDGRWYLIGHDIDRAAMRTYALGRIADVTFSARWFERPKDFSVDRYFASALGVMTGTENHHVRIRFSKLAADHVRDRYWHESQEFVALPDGRLELRLRLADLLEVERLILQWGGHAEALEPAELRIRLAAAGKAIERAHA